MAHTKKRIPELDIVRGFLIILLVIDHFFYDVAFFVNQLFPAEAIFNSALQPFVSFARNYWYSPIREVVRQICLLLFFVVSGICASFSKNNLRRSLKLMLFSTIATFLSFGYSYLTKNWDFLIEAGAAPMYWLFPIFFCYGFSIFIYEMIHRLTKLIMRRDSMVAPFIAFFLGMSILAIFIHFNLYDAPWESYERSHFWKYILGFANCREDFDSWPLIPFMGYLLIGVFVGFVVYNHRTSLIFKNENNLFVRINKPVSFLGRHSLWVYILHQVFILPVLYLVFYLIV